MEGSEGAQIPPGSPVGTVEPVLQVMGLGKRFVEGGRARGRHGRWVVRDVSFSVQAGEVVGLVGESGTGKSTIARLLTGLTPVTTGTIRLEGRDITHVGGREGRRARTRMQMIFQDAGASLDPRAIVADIIAEPMIAQGSSRAAIERRTGEVLKLVGLTERFLLRRPAECSGGEQQRIAIARAMAIVPSVLLADEPFSSVDVSTQFKLARLFRQLRDELGTSLFIIGHDLPVISAVCDRVCVMFGGALCEIGDAEAVLTDPHHPYTRALVEAARLTTVTADSGRDVPAMSEPVGEAQRVAPGGGAAGVTDTAGMCPYAARCERCVEECWKSAPALTESGHGRLVACFRPYSESTREKGRHG